MPYCTCFLRNHSASVPNQPPKMCRDTSLAGGIPPRKSSSKTPDLSSSELGFCLDEESVRRGKESRAVNPKWKLVEVFLQLSSFLLAQPTPQKPTRLTLSQNLWDFHLWDQNLRNFKLYTHNCFHVYQNYNYWAIPGVVTLPKVLEHCWCGEIYKFAESCNSEKYQRERKIERKIERKRVEKEKERRR